MTSQHVIKTAFGGYVLYGFQEDLDPLAYPSPPGLVSPLTGAIEAIDHAVFVWPLTIVGEDVESERLVISLQPPPERLPTDTVFASLGLSAVDYVWLETFEREFIDELPSAAGWNEYKLAMVPARPGVLQVHYLWQ